jgi:hypothetical protein
MMLVVSGRQRSKVVARHGPNDQGTIYSKQKNAPRMKNWPKTMATFKSFKIQIIFNLDFKKDATMSRFFETIHFRLLTCFLCVVRRVVREECQLRTLTLRLWILLEASRDNKQQAQKKHARKKEAN